MELSGVRCPTLQLTLLLTSLPVLEFPPSRAFRSTGEPLVLAWALGSWFADAQGAPDEPAAGCSATAAGSLFRPPRRA